MGKQNDVSWKHVLAALIAAGIMFLGVVRAFDKKTSAWVEMFYIVRDIGLWLFACIAAVTVLWLIYFTFKAILDKSHGFYVQWKQSKIWCEKIEKDLTEMNVEYRKISSFQDSLEEEVCRLKQVIQAMSAELKKLAKPPVPEVQAQIQNAENELTGSRN